MKQAACEKILLDSENNLEKIQNAVKKHLGVSLPFLADIAHHIITPHNNSTRSLLLLQSASLFKKPDDDVIDIDECSIVIRLTGYKNYRKQSSDMFKKNMCSPDFQHYLTLTV